MPVEILREDSDAYRSESERWLNDTWLPTLEDGRDALLQIDGNSKRYTDLLHAVERRQVIPLIGSGMSVASGCPTWSNLLRKIRDFTKIDVAALEKLLSAGGFEEAADLIASGTNPNLLNERVEHDLRIEPFFRTLRSRQIWTTFLSNCTRNAACRLHMCSRVWMYRDIGS